jgi:acetyl-CoA carboxylase biotin carboxyl carrier protein
MTNENVDPATPIDLQRLRDLIALMEAHGLTEVDLRQGGQRWKLRRGPAEGAFAMAPFPWPAQPGAAPKPEPAPAAPAALAAPAAEAADTALIKSPTVGTFYEAPAPGERPYAPVGTKVTSDTVVCIIEAMKVFNPVAAEVNGTIVEVLVKNGDAVEFGQPLFRVRLG